MLSSVQEIKKIINQQGQTFLIVLMVMLVAMFVGVSSASRFMKSIRTISAADDAAKAQAIAEAAIERILLVPSDTLADYINNSNCGTDCYYEITDANGQLLTANITLSFVGNTISNYTIKVETDEANQVTLEGYQSGRTLDVCWNGSETSIVGHYLYTSSGVTESTPFAYNPVLTINDSNGFTLAAANFGYDNCFTVTASDTPLALRFRAVYEAADLTVFPQAGYSIPVQGIVIESVGKANNAVKTVTVIKSKSFTPAPFDFVLYQKSWTDSLSN